MKYPTVMLGFEHPNGVGNTGCGPTPHSPPFLIHSFPVMCLHWFQLVLIHTNLSLPPSHMRARVPGASRTGRHSLAASPHRPPEELWAAAMEGSSGRRAAGGVHVLGAGPLLPTPSSTPVAAPSTMGEPRRPPEELWAAAMVGSSGRLQMS